MNNLHGAFALLLLSFLGSTGAQTSGDKCFSSFHDGRQDFVLDADESVQNGATYLSSPELTQRRDCLAACCKEPKCNVAFMELGEHEDAIKSCFLFDCLYKKQYACRFVRKKGYINYILESVYDSYLQENTPPSKTDQPPIANGGPDLVIQPQESVTLNGIGSKDDFEIVSYQWQLLTNYPYAIIEKTSFNDQIIVSNLTSGIYKFKLTVIDNSGQSGTAIVTVLVLTPEQSEHHCMAPKKIGPCRGSFPRWHHNAASQKCELFMFGGCRENLNNYLTENECNKACASSDQTKSGRLLPLPSDQGEKCGSPCTPDEFTCANGCCLDPGLECDSTPQCSDGSDEQKCTDLDSKFRILLQIPTEESKVRCTELPDTGICRDSLTKWYYNPIHEDCFRFNYGGCQGNENRFESHDACMKMCRTITEKDVFARREEFDTRVSESQTGIIAIAAVLGVAIFVLLIILGYCFMKGKKKSTQHRPINTVPVATLEDRERLVYNSTTKPI